MADWFQTSKGWQYVFLSDGGAVLILDAVRLQTVQQLGGGVETLLWAGLINDIDQVETIPYSPDLPTIQAALLAAAETWTF